MAAKESRRDLILGVARVLFVARGYEGTTIGDIADQLDISKAAVTYYFPAKADFMTALLDPLLNDLNVAVAGHPSPAWPDGARQLFADYYRVLLSSADLALWMDTDPALRIGDRPGSRLRSLDQELARRIVHPSERREDQMRALAAVGGLWRPLHHEPADEILSHLDEIVDAALISYAPLERS